MVKSKKAAKLDAEITMDRRSNRERRKLTDRRRKEVKVDVEKRKSPRRTVQRRRQIDPTTCERDYTADEIEFMQAMDAYKRSSGRMFPTCSEILEVVRGLGYERKDAAATDPTQNAGTDTQATEDPTVEDQDDDPTTALFAAAEEEAID